VFCSSAKLPNCPDSVIIGYVVEDRRIQGRQSGGLMLSTSQSKVSQSVRSLIRLHVAKLVIVNTVFDVLKT